MNKEKNIVQITRSRYKQIKKMDHNSMERAIEHYTDRVTRMAGTQLRKT